MNQILDGNFLLCYSFHWLKYIVNSNMSRSNFAFIFIETIAKEQKFGHLEFNMNLIILPSKYYPATFPVYYFVI